MLGERNVKLTPQIMEAEDFSFYTQKMSATFFLIGTNNKTLKSNKGLHSPHFIIDEDVLSIGAALHAAVAIIYLDGNVESTH